MGWCEYIILFLVMASVSLLVFAVNLISIIKDLRIENYKLKVDLLHK